MQDDDEKITTIEWADYEVDEEFGPPVDEFRRLKLAVASMFVVAVIAGGGWWLWSTIETPRASEEYLEQAQAYLGEGKDKSALVQLKNALQQDDANAEARFLLGELYFNLGDMASAEKELRRARGLGYETAQVVPLLARVYLAQGKSVELITLPVDGLPGPERGEVLASQGLAHANSGNVEKGVALIQLALKAAPGNELVMLSRARLLASEGDLIGARAQIKAVLERNARNTSALVLLGDIELNEGSFAGAEAAYSKAMEVGGNPIEARLKRAQVRIQQQNFDAAQADVDELMARHPNNTLFHFMQGVIHFQNQDFQGTVTSMALAEKSSQRFPATLLYAGISHYKLGNTNQARDYAVRFHQLAPGNAYGRRLMALVELSDGNYVAAEKILRSAVSASPNDTAALNLLANALLAQGQMEEGIELLARVAELQPDSSAAQVRLGAGKLLAGDIDTGVERLESALAINPELQQADIMLVINHLQRQDYEKAIAAAQAYHQRQPAEARPYNLLGSVYLAAGQTDKAREAFANALEIEPGQPAGNHSLAEMALQEGDYSTAKKHYDTVLAAHENYLPTLLKLANWSARQDDPASLVAYLQRAMEHHPDQVAPRLLMGRYYLEVGRPEQVEPLFTGLDEDLQNRPGVLVLVGTAQIAEKDYHGAKFTLEKRAGMPPPSPEVHQLLAQAHAYLGEIRQAEQQLEKALQLSPEYLPSRFMIAHLYISEGRIDEAGPHLAELRRLAADSQGLLRLEAALARRRGDEQQALAYAERAYEEFPNSTTMLQLVVTLRRQGDSAREKKLLADWLARHPEDTRAKLALANAQAEGGANAVRQYEDVLKLDRDNVMALNNLAWALRESQPKRALDYAERAAELAPDSAAIRDTLAMVLLNNGEIQRAQRAIARVLDQEPSQPTFRYHSALINARAGDRDSALAALAPLLESGETFPEQEAAQLLYRELQSGG